MPRLRLTRPAAAAALALLSGCASATSGPTTLVCPGAAVLATAAHLVQFRAGAAEDVRGLALTARLHPPTGSCTLAGRGLMRVKARISLTAALGPAATSRVASIAYFVAVTRGDAILSKSVVALPLRFPPGVDRLAVTGRPLVFEVPLPASGSAAAYQVLAGFQLTPAELAYNRAHPAP
ncbi:MAG: hypothetical protein ACP5NI_00075 [Acetobacteraceae bacterium]